MPTASQRAERLDIVRDLVVLGTEEEIRNRDVLQRKAVDEHLLVRIDSGEPLSDTSKYRYLDALRFLKLDIAEKYGRKEDIVWSPIAEKLAYYGKHNYRTEKLSAHEKKILRKSIFQSDASRQFLSVFCESNITPRSQEDFLSSSSPLYIINTKARRPKRFKSSTLEWPAVMNVEISLDPDSERVIRKPTKEFLYTYRYWCLDTDIVDELNVQESERCGIPKNRSYVMFPIAPNSKSITPSRFLDILYSVFGKEMKRPKAVPVPWLMYKICPKMRISVERFQDLLVMTWKENRQVVHLERGAGGLIRGEIRPSEYRHSQRYGNQRYYTVINGTIRSNLVLFPRT